MLDNKRRIGERKSKICLFHYPHDKIPPKKNTNKANLKPSTQHNTKTTSQRTSTENYHQRLPQKKKRTHKGNSWTQKNKQDHNVNRLFRGWKFRIKAKFLQTKKAKRKKKKENLQFLNTEKKQDLNLNRPNVSRIQSSN